MLDIKRIRENPKDIKTALLRRGKDYSEIIDEIISLDEERRTVGSENDNLKAEQNKKSKEMPALQKSGQDISELLRRMKMLSAIIKENDVKIAAVEKRQKQLLLGIPNIPSKDVHTGSDSEENKEIKRFKEPVLFDFNPLPHWEIGKALDILEPERAAKVAGARFHFYKGAGAALERAIMNFFLDTHTSRHGYTELLPPFIVNADSMTGTGQLPKFEEDMFKIEGTEYYLIPTAEVPVTNFHRDEILKGEQLPMNYCAYSACFRAEGGAAGRDTRGLIRQHQFNKVELVKFTKPEESYKELEKLTRDAEECLELLELPYRRMLLCSGDMGAGSAKTYDIEVWLPSYNRYAEISSCSNFEDYQARRMAIRFKDTESQKAQLVHTLNGSGLAIGRTTAAILENYQNKNGSVTVPKVLQKYMGIEVIERMI